MNKRKQEELERLSWFCNIPLSSFTDEEIKSYFLFSETGLGNGGRLNVCKERVGMTLGMWEESFLKDDGSWVGYYSLIRDKHGSLIPRHIIDFIKKEMFKGSDSDIIESNANCS